MQAKIPAGITEGMTFKAIVDGETITLTVPPGLKPGDMLPFTPPAAAPEGEAEHVGEEPLLSFEIPEGYKSGDKIEVEVEGKQIELVIPDGLKPGDEMHFKAPN